MIDLRRRNPIYFNCLLDRLDTIATQIWDKLHCICNNFIDRRLIQDFYRQLETDIMWNQQLLKDNDLSLPKFNEVCSIANKFGLKGKLTGFTGGYVYILLSPKVTDETINKIKAQFLKQRIDCISSTFDIDGVKID
ncbi:uncharacterized protein LOC114937431 [Nylanderia fulva]|nr:uncharacterized protein LOC114937431 [Nylanderia fulva]